MGGILSTPVAPVQSNEAQINANLASIEQNNLLLSQMEESRVVEARANEAHSETLRELELRDAQAEAERLEREQRSSRGNRDLLFMNALGVEDDEDEDMLLLGGG